MPPSSDVDAVAPHDGGRFAARAAVRAVGGGPWLLNHWATLAVLVACLLQGALVSSVPWLRALYLLGGLLNLWRLYTQLRLRAVLRQPLGVVVAVTGPARAAMFSDALGRSLPLSVRPRHARAAAVDVAVQASALAAELGCAQGHLPLCPHQMSRAGLGSAAELREALRTGALPAT